MWYRYHWQFDISLYCRGQRLLRERTTRPSHFEDTRILWGPSATNPIPFSQPRYVKGPPWARYSPCAQIPDGYKAALCALISRELIHYFLLVRSCRLKKVLLYIFWLSAVIYPAFITPIAEKSDSDFEKILFVFKPLNKTTLATSMSCTLILLLRVFSFKCFARSHVVLSQIPKASQNIVMISQNLVIFFLWINELWKIHRRAVGPFFHLYRLGLDITHLSDANPL